MDWIHVAQDKVQWWTLVNWVRNLCFLMTSWGAIRSSKRTVLPEVSYLRWQMFIQLQISIFLLLLDSGWVPHIHIFTVVLQITWYHVCCMSSKSELWLQIFW
jgi:hypothetical protein